MKKSGNREEFFFHFRFPVPGSRFPFLLLLIAFLFASCAPNKPLFVRKNKTFFYDYFRLYETKNVKTIDLSQFNGQNTYYDFHIGGKFDIEMPNVWGKPFDFTTKGNDETAAFNAWIALAVHLGKLQESYPDFNFYFRPHVYREIFVFPDISPQAFSWDSGFKRFPLSREKKMCFDATNDALTLSALLFNHTVRMELLKLRNKIASDEWSKKSIIYHKWQFKREFKPVKETYDSLASLIDDNGHLSCCIIDGKVYNEMYSRHGLVIASLVYAYKILGKELYAEKAKKLADYFIAHNYHKEGYFDNWISIGTDSEICTGLLEVYDITGDKKYLDVCEAVAHYYDSPHAKMTHDPQGHEDLRHKQDIYSTVDQAEFVILLKNLYAFTKNKHYLAMARGILKDLQMCYDTKWKLYSHMCYWNGKHDDHFFAVIQALIYIAML